MGGDGFAAADGVDTFVGLGFEVDGFGRDAEGFCERFAHFCKVRAEFWFFGDDDSIHVLNFEAFLVEEFAGVFEKLEAVGALPFGIGVGKMRTDIAEGGCAEKRVAHGVGENIAIGVTDWALVEWKSDASNDEWAACCEAVEVVADAAADSAVAHAWWTLARSISR